MEQPVRPLRSGCGRGAEIRPCVRGCRSLTCSESMEKRELTSSGSHDNGTSLVANRSKGIGGGRSLTRDMKVAFKVSLVVFHSDSIRGR